MTSEGTGRRHECVRRHGSPLWGMCWCGERFEDFDAMDDHEQNTAVWMGTLPGDEKDWPVEMVAHPKALDLLADWIRTKG